MGLLYDENSIIIIVDRTRSTHKHNKANVKKEKIS